jgi:DNA-binding beta-propeller fold protein YncE
VYSLRVGNAPSGIAITADGTKALVANVNDNTVTVLDLTTSPFSQAQDPIPGFNIPQGIAITPDGTKALVTNEGMNAVSVLDLMTSPIVPFPYTVAVEAPTAGIAITPDGALALVAQNDGNIAVLDLLANPITASYTVPVGVLPTGIAISPDGTMALVTNNGDTATPIPGTVSVLDLTTSPITVLGYTVPVNFGPVGVAITPDGTRAYVVNSDNGYGVCSFSVLDLTQSPVTPIGSSIPIGVVPTGVAITPDQAPTSLFTFTISGSTVAFDGSNSSSPVGGIKSYIWDFGDGSTPEVTASPTVSHTYAQMGQFTASLTVVNDAGTSLNVIYTGQTISNRGLPRAKSSQQVFLGVTPPSNFTGRVYLDCEQKKVFLETEWTASPDTDLTRYEIFDRDTKVATVEALDELHATLQVQEPYFPYRVSKEYRHYLNSKYKIRAVNQNGFVSPFVSLRVQH